MSQAEPNIVLNISTAQRSSQRLRIHLPLEKRNLFSPSQLEMPNMTPLNRRPMQHIDRRDLYTSLEARIQYLHSFLDFSSRKAHKSFPF